MTIMDWFFLAVFANTFLVGIGIALIRIDIKELKELIEEKIK